MTDKEKIRKEVQRLMGELIQEKEKGFGSDSDDTCILELQNVLTYIDSLQEEPVIGLDNGNMPIDRWKQAVEAASNQKNYRSSKGFTETRDDYFVDGVQWADEHPKEEPVSIWHDPSKETPIQHSNILMIRKEEGSDFPPIAGCFNGTNSRLDGRNWGYYNGFCYNEIELPLKWAYVDDILNLPNVERTVKDWKEPVSEELEQAAVEAFKQIVDSDKNNFLEIFKAGAEWQKEKEYTCYEEAFEDGAKWKVENLWKPADGDDLPEIDREVIVLVQDYPDDKDHLRVAFAHRPSKYAKFWNSTLGEEQVVEIEGYDKGGWNIPDVKYWLDCSMPKEIEI